MVAEKSESKGEERRRIHALARVAGGPSGEPGGKRPSFARIGRLKPAPPRQSKVCGGFRRALVEGC